MMDARGDLKPVETIPAFRQLEDEVVRKEIGFALALSQQIGRFKGHGYENLGSLDALLQQEFKITKGGVKGNRTYSTFDGLFRVMVRVQDKTSFGPELSAAKILFDECMTEWAEDTGGGLSFDGVDDMLTAPAQVVREVFMVVSGMSGGTGADGVYPLFSEVTVNRSYVHVINGRRISVDGTVGTVGAAAVGLAPYEPATLDGKNMTLSSGDMLSATPVIISIAIPGGVEIANIAYLQAAGNDFRNHFNLHSLIAFADRIDGEDREQVIRYLADKTGAAL